jgi:toxin YoeB
MPYELKLTPKAGQDCQYWLKHNPSYLKKIEKLLKAIKDDPFKGIGKPEPLQYSLQNFWSRRISKEHRIWYVVKDNLIAVYRCYGHY